jgi:CheY-like chemotaxis protein
MAHILIAEDQPDIATVTKTLLSAWGHQVTIARDGQEALLFASSESFDLALVDVRMPGMDGFVLTEQLSGSLSVLGFTASADQQTRQRLLNAGAEEVVVKPFEARDLREAIERCLDANH